MAVVVEVDRVRFDLRVDEPFTFGRDCAICTACLGADPLDLGISRLAGSISYGNGTWSISNLSSARSLHVVDLETGIAVPLPVARENWPPARHPVDRRHLAVLVRGEILTHEIVVSASEDDLLMPDDLPLPVDQLRTRTYLPPLTDKQREAFVALVEGYLLRHPRYSPEPRTYEEAAQRLDLPASTVRKRIENVRRLMDAGVSGLESGDARRNLAEWLLSNRLVTAADLDWLDGRPPEGRG